MHVLPYQHTHLADFVYLGDDAAHFTADNGQSILAAGVGQPQFKGMGTDLVETAVRHNVIGGGQCFQNGGNGTLWQVQKIGDLRQAQTAGIGVDQLQNPEDPQGWIVIFHEGGLQSFRAVFREAVECG